MANNIMGRSGGNSFNTGRFLKSDSIGQQMVSLIANLCFALFVIGVLIFTILAATYQPADPFLQPSKAITTYLTATSNATFAVDDSVVRTGEDFAAPKGAAEKPINASEVSAVEKKTEQSTVMVSNSGNESEPVKCDPGDGEINCSDREVFAAIMKYCIENFQDIKFYRFGRPVRGSNESSCDMSWRFKPKVGGKANFFYKDYRRFYISRGSDCKYVVSGAGEWHSGTNVRRRKQKQQVGFEPERLKNVSGSLPAVGEVVNDSLPVVKSESSFSKGKYLMYSKGGDYCKGMSQYLWSFLCALGEAQYLNRTFVIDLSVCLSGSNNPGHPDEDGKDFRFYFDFEHLKESASVIDQAQFWQDWNKWQKTDGLTLNMVQDLKVTPMQLREDPSSLIWRTFDKEPDNNYWYRVCEGETENVIQRPWDLIWKSKRLLEIVSAISAKLNWDFDSVHIVRGEKAQNKERWPNLERDTAPDALLEKLKYKIDEGRDLYIATNEADISFFDPLKSAYKPHFLTDYSYLWATNSEWYNETMEITGGKPVEFDGYMRVEVDTEVFYRGKKQIETFGDLTKDCKDGAGTCSS